MFNILITIIFLVIAYLGYLYPRYSQDEYPYKCSTYSCNYLVKANTIKYTGNCISFIDNNNQEINVCGFYILTQRETK